MRLRRDAIEMIGTYLERRVQQRTAPAKALPGRIHRLLERAMDDGCVVMPDDAVYVANFYAIFLNPDDLAALGPLLEELEASSEQMCRLRIDSKGFKTMGTVGVIIEADARVARHQVWVNPYYGADRPASERGRITIGKTQVYRQRQRVPAPRRLLRFVEAPQRYQVCSIDCRVTTIGREVDNDIVLFNSTVSRHHARIEYVDQHYELVDLDSVNHTFVNGARISRTRLSPGDVVAFDTVEATFLEPHDATCTFA